jgi:hypothetical protein
MVPVVRVLLWSLVRIHICGGLASFVKCRPTGYCRMAYREGS